MGAPPAAPRAAAVAAGPVLWSQGTGADVMKRIAAPVVDGVVTSAVLELLVSPAIYMIWKGRRLPETTPEPAGPW